MNAWHGVEALLLTFALLWLLFAATRHLVPQALVPLRVVSRFLARIGRQVVRRLGVAWTLWLALLLLTVLSTASLVSGGGGGCAALSLGLIVLAVWWLLRWRARRRYTPRPLPGRWR